MTQFVHSQTEKRLAPFRLGTDPVRLRDVIALHRKYLGASSLGGNIGDGYLCATNPVYRNVRAEFLRRGFRFTTDVPAEYELFSTMCLDRLIASRTVPCYENFSWLERIEAQVPDRFDLESLRKADLRKNYLFHESVHCIAHSALFGDAQPGEIARDPRALVKAQLGEAYASTVEALSWIFATSQIGCYFLEANTAFRPRQEGVADLMFAARELGFQTTIELLIYGFLYSGFLYNRLDEPELEAIARFTGTDPASPAFRGAVRVGLDSDEIFRAETSILYLAQQGYSDETLRALEGDPAELLTADVRAGVSELAALVKPGLAEEFC